MLPDRDTLEAELHDLAQRVARLETAMGIAAHPVAALPQGPAPAFEAASALPIVGRALIGLAGAYLLRALSESGVIGPIIGVGAGVLYAISWLVWASRAQATIHSITSVLILCPLLWEATVRLHAITPPIAAGVLLFFTVFGLTISWITTLAGLGTAFALLATTHDNLPFTLFFLVVAAAVEFKNSTIERWLVAPVVDLAVIYAAVPLRIALIVIYLPSIARRTLAVFDALQLAAVFAIAVYTWKTPAALVGGATCAVAAILARGRNFHIFAAFAVALIAAGTWMQLPVWLALAIAGYGLAIRYNAHPAWRLASAAAVIAVITGLVPPAFRTSVISALALLLAWKGPWQLMYPTMLLGAYFVAVNPRFVSLLVYGATLIALPRLRRFKAAGS